MTHAPISTNDWNQLHALYPAMVTALDPAATLALPVMDVPAGTTLFRETDPCQGFPLLLSGEVRVSRSASNGRELELSQKMDMDLEDIASYPPSIMEAYQEKKKQNAFLKRKEDKMKKIEDNFH